MSRRHHLSRRTAWFGLGLLVAAFGLGTGLWYWQWQQTPAAHTPAVTGSHRFGMAVGSSFEYADSQTQNRQLDDMKTLGVAWVRFDIDWARVQPDDAGQYDWSYADTAISNIQSHGMTPLPILNTAPAWARANPSCTSLMCAPNASAFAQFANAAAHRYSSRGVHAWEIWNEPNLDANWQPAASPAEYAGLLQAVAPAMRAADHHVFIVSAGLSPGGYQPLKYVQAMYEAGAQPNFDALGYHPYCWSDGPACQTVNGSAWNQMANTSTSLRSIMASFGDSAKRIWMTEFGAPIAGNPHAVTPEQQAQNITSAFAYAAQQPWAGPVFIYTYQLSATDANDVEAWFGIVNADGSHRPAYDAYRAASQSAR